MAVKHAKFLFYGEDEQCAEMRKLIEEAGVILDVRDIEKKPLTEDELASMLGHLEAAHFLNPASDSYEKNKLDQKIPQRHELIKMIADDYTLLRKPIIRTARLLTVGCDKQKISEMLRLNGDSDNGRENSNFNRQRSGSGGRSDYRRSSAG
jgi:arsenate reductase-like glutaredoxin family protein